MDLIFWFPPCHLHPGPTLAFLGLIASLMPALSHLWRLASTPFRNGNFAGFSGHSPLLEWVWEHRNRGWNVLRFFFKTRIKFGTRSGLVIICPAPNMKLQVYPLPINICFLWSFLVFLSRFRSSYLVLGFSFLSIPRVVDENTSDDGDGAVPNYLRQPHHTRLPRPHSVPASSVKKWLSKSLSFLFSSLKHIPNLQSTAQVFVKMLKDGVFWIVGVLNA